MSIVLDGTTGITTPGLTNTGTETLVNLTTTGNTILGDASTDTLNVGNGGLIKDASGNVGVSVTPVGLDTRFKNLEVGPTASLSSILVSSTNLLTYVQHNSYVDASGATKFKYTGGSNYASQYNQNNGSHVWQSSTAAGTGGNACTFPTVFSQGGVGKTFAFEGASSQTGTGITFPATQSASSDANTLDDYEEGTWTPVPSPGSGALGGYTSSGNYTKIGRTVYVIGNIYITGGGTASGGMDITGLPFTSLNTTARPSIVLCREDQSTGVIYAGAVNKNATSLFLSSLTGGSLVYSANYNYSFCFTYQVA